MLNVTDLRLSIVKEGIKLDPSNESFDMFPEGLDFGTKSDGEEKAVEMFLSFYRNPNYSCYYVTESFSELTEIFEKYLDEYPTPLCLKTERFCYKILVGYYSSSFLFSYENEIGEVCVGILYPSLLERCRKPL